MDSSTLNDERSQFWSKDKVLGYPTSLVDYAKVAAPLLAGFSLSAAIALAGRSSRGLRGDIAVLAFALAAALLIFAIQAALNASMYQTSPADRLAWWPEVRTNTSVADQVRRDQWLEAATAKKYRTRTRWTYNLGIIAFLAGLLAALVPGPGTWNAVRIATLSVIGLAIFVELIGTVERPVFLLRLLSPARSDLENEVASTMRAV